MHRLLNTVPVCGTTTLFIISRSLSFGFQPHWRLRDGDHCLYVDHPGTVTIDVLPDEDDDEDAGTSTEDEGPAEEVLITGSESMMKLQEESREALQGSWG